MTKKTWDQLVMIVQTALTGIPEVDSPGRSPVFDSQSQNRFD